MIISNNKFKKTAVALATVAFLSFSMPNVTMAKPGGSKQSSGSRGSHTNESVPSTNTAPRTSTPQTQGTQNRAPEPQKGGFFSRFGAGIAGGLLGAGLFSMLSGGGFGGLGGMLMGLLQIALIGGLIMLAIRFFRRKQEPAMAGVPNSQSFQAPQHTIQSYNAPVQAPVKERSDDVGIAGDDYNAFENLLTKVQDAYGREAIAELKPLVTPVMLKDFSDEIAENTRRGVHNQCGGAKLLSGDLAESWKENGQDYATVTVRYSLYDVTKNRSNGNVIEGSMSTPIEVTEHWTFVRSIGQPWMLSGIDQI